MAPRLALNTLGEASVARLGGTEPEILLGPGKPVALFVYLACCPRRSAQRDHLIDLLWADLDGEAARHALRQTVWHVRQRLGPDALQTENGDLSLGAPVVLDRDRFLEAVERGELELAVQLYRGDFLASMALPGGIEFEHWADAERCHLKLMFLRAAEALTRQYLARARQHDARKLAQRIRDVEPYSQSGWRLLFETLLSGDDKIGAAAEADRLERLLREDHREPEPATREIMALARRDPGPDTAQPAQGSALVAEMVGREKEFSAIVRLWESARTGAAHHVHVTAAAGLGKTRLLTDVHARLRAQGARTLLLRANPGERFVAYALAADLVEALAAFPGATGVSSAVAGTLVDLNPSLSSKFPTAKPGRARRADLGRMRTIALVELLAAVSDDGPVALLVDDLHWGDRESCQLLLGLIGKLRSNRCLVVTASRPGHTVRMRCPDTTSLELAPLDASHIGQLIESLGSLPGDAWAVELPQSVFQATSGSPLLVLETLHLAVERATLRLEGGEWRAPNVPELSRALAAGSATRRRVEELGRSDLWLLLFLSTAGAPVDVPTLVKAAQRSHAAIAKDLDDLERRGFVMRDGDGWVPAHDEIAATVRQVASDESRRAAGRVLGRLLIDASDNDPDLLRRAARHLASAGEIADVTALFARWVVSSRCRGDRRSVRALAADLLGDAAAEPDVRRLVTSLPLHVRAGLYTTRRALTAAVAGAAVVAGCLVAAAGPAAPAADALLLAEVSRPGGSTVVYAIPLRNDGWERGRPIDVVRDGVPVSQLDAPYQAHGVVPRPDGKAWAVTKVAPDSGGINLFLVHQDGTERRLTFSGEEDLEAGWSPDGRHLVFSARRWDPLARYDLAVIDTDSALVRPLARSDAIYAAPLWGPSGTRIAFSRVAWGETGTRTCWAPADGSYQRCFAAPRGFRTSHPLAWYDYDRLLIRAHGADSVTLGLLHVESGAFQAIPSPAGTSADAVSPDARWGLGKPIAGDEEARWQVFPLNEPHLARPLTLGATAASVVGLWWGSPGKRLPYLDRIDIVAPPEEIPVNAPFRLHAQGVGPGGEAVPIPVRTWTSSDTTIATVNAKGTVFPRRAGEVTVTLSAGGWRSASTRLRVTRPAHRIDLSEAWSAAESGREWRLFGDPIPNVTTGPDGIRALWNRGDGSFLNGAYTHRTFSVSRGLGIEVLVSTPLTMLQWQDAFVALVPDDSAGLAAWDHRTGSPPGRNEVYEGTAGCGVHYLRPEGKHPKLLVMGDGRALKLDAPAAMASGRWYTLRIQLLADGSCGVAIDGTPVALIRSGTPRDGAFRALIGGGSRDTRILHGPLEVWRGVKGDIDWRHVRSCGATPCDGTDRAIVEAAR